MVKYVTKYVTGKICHKNITLFCAGWDKPLPVSHILKVFLALFSNAINNF